MFTIITFFIFIFISTIAKADIITGLLAEWKLDEATTGTCAGASIVDSTGNGNTGTCNNSPVWIAGKIGGAISLVTASSQYINISGTNFQINTGSVSAWINPTSNTNGETVATFHSLDGNNRQFSPFETSEQGNGTYKLIPTAVNTAGTIVYVCSTNMTFNNSIWHHVVYTSVDTSGTFNYYVDGVPITSFTCSSGSKTNFFFGNAMNNGDGIALGTKTDHTKQVQNPFTGYIDEVRIYNRALSAADVAQLYVNFTKKFSHAHLANFHSNY